MSADAKRAEFAQRLLDYAPLHVVQAMRETVASGHDIVVGAWARKNDEGQPCGCLLMDGLATKAPEDWQLVFEADSNSVAADTLTDFYNIDYRTFDGLMNAVFAWDEWMNAADLDGGNYLIEGDEDFLTDVARAATIEVLDNVIHELSATPS